MLDGTGTKTAGQLRVAENPVECRGIVHRVVALDKQTGSSCSMMKGSPPTAAAITGVPQDCASAATSPKAPRAGGHDDGIGGLVEGRQRLAGNRRDEMNPVGKTGVPASSTQTRAISASPLATGSPDHHQLGHPASVLTRRKCADRDVDTFERLDAADEQHVGSPVEPGPHSGGFSVSRPEHIVPDPGR